MYLWTDLLIYIYIYLFIYLFVYLFIYLHNTHTQSSRALRRSRHNAVPSYSKKTIAALNSQCLRQPRKTYPFLIGNKGIYYKDCGPFLPTKEYLYRGYIGMPMPLFPTQNQEERISPARSRLMSFQAVMSVFASSLACGELPNKPSPGALSLSGLGFRHWAL